MLVVPDHGVDENSVGRSHEILYSIAVRPESFYQCRVGVQDREGFVSDLLAGSRNLRRERIVA